MEPQQPSLKINSSNKCTLPPLLFPDQSQKHIPSPREEITSKIHELTLHESVLSSYEGVPIPETGLPQIAQKIIRIYFPSAALNNQECIHQTIQQALRWIRPAKEALLLKTRMD